MRFVSIVIVMPRIRSNESYLLVYEKPMYSFNVWSHEPVFKPGPEEKREKKTKISRKRQMKEGLTIINMKVQYIGGFGVSVSLFNLLYFSTHKVVHFLQWGRCT